MSRDYDLRPFSSALQDFDFAINSLRRDDPVRAMLITLRGMLEEARKVRQDVVVRLRIPAKEVGFTTFPGPPARREIANRLGIEIDQNGDPTLGIFAEFAIGSMQNIEDEIRIATDILDRQAKRYEKYVDDIANVRRIRKLEGGVKALRSATISIFIKECAIVSYYILITLFAIAAMIFAIHQFVLN